MEYYTRQYMDQPAPELNNNTANARHWLAAYLSRKPGAIAPQTECADIGRRQCGFPEHIMVEAANNSRMFGSVRDKSEACWSLSPS